MSTLNSLVIIFSNTIYSSKGISPLNQMGKKKSGVTKVKSKETLAYRSNLLADTYEVGQYVIKKNLYNKCYSYTGKIISKECSPGGQKFCYVSWENNPDLVLMEHYIAIMPLPNKYKMPKPMTIETTRSSKLLVEALEKIDESLLLKDVIDKAKNNEYDDFYCNHPTPKYLLLHDLESFMNFVDEEIQSKLISLAKRIRSGEFDASLEEGEDWMRRTSLEKLV